MIDGETAQMLFEVFSEWTFLRDGVLAVPWHVAIDRSRTPLRIIGLVCDSHGCNFLARFRCYWPAQTTVKCGRCTEALCRVAIAMGFELQTRTIDVATGADDAEMRFSLLEFR